MARAPPAFAHFQNVVHGSNFSEGSDSVGTWPGFVVLNKPLARAPPALAHFQHLAVYELLARAPSDENKFP